METIVLDIEKIIAPIVSSRDSINRLEGIIRRMRSNNIELDFSNIDFISRAATHELLLMKERLLYRLFFKKVITFINMNIDVFNMIRIVAANRVAPKEHIDDQELEIVSVEQLLSRKNQDPKI